MAVDSEVHKSLPFHMALRVLLADESTTIKKVLQLALQDFAVEVKSVHSGVDVVEVTRSFLPDIVFADVLLQKKNGYEVTTDLKNDADLNSIPVVLMWSSFMELDEGAALRSRADRRLEKPFDVESLRQLVLELVPKTRSQRLAHFLKFPESVTDPLLKEEQQKSKAPPPKSLKTKAPGPDETALISTEEFDAPQEPARVPPSAGPNQSSNWSMDSFQDIDEFSSEVPEDNASQVDPGEDESFVELKLNHSSTGNAPPPVKPQAPLKEAKSHEENEPWSHQSLSRFQIQNPDVGRPLSDSDDAYEIELTSQVDTASFAGQLDKGIEPFSNSEHAEEFNLELENEQQTGSRPLNLQDHGAFRLQPAPAPQPQPPPRPSQSSELREAPELNLTLETQSNSDEDRLELDENSGIPQITPEHLEAIIRSQSRDVIETVVRRLIPDLATQIIREELARLLADGPGAGPQPTPSPNRGKPVGTSTENLPRSNPRETSARK